MSTYFVLRSPPSSHDDSMNIPFDPCDKNVVVSALKQKRYDY